MVAKPAREILEPDVQRVGAGFPLPGNAMKKDLAVDVAKGILDIALLKRGFVVPKELIR